MEGARPLSRIIAIGAVGLLAFPTAALAQQKGELLQHQYEGTLGESRIGMTVIREGNDMKGGHYFYQRLLKDIPITGSISGSGITIAEAGTGVFHLRFVGNGSEGNRPLDFENSIGMDGTWTSVDGIRTYPVSLRGTVIRPSAVGGCRYSGVTDESDQSFERRIQAFLRAVLSGDKAAAVRFISYPVRVNFANDTSKNFRNSAGVLAAWTDLFNPALMGKLRSALPHDMFTRNGMVMLGNGEAWFDSKGLAALNVPPAYEAPAQEIFHLVCSRPDQNDREFSAHHRLLSANRAAGRSRQDAARH